jgi:hypothetical protein
VSNKKELKTKIMKTDSTQQEILLVMGTSFSSREWSFKDNDNKNYFTEREQLEEACYNGLLEEILPEVFMQMPAEKKLYLWDIKEGNSFIELELGEVPKEMDNRYSIDPYSFLHLQLFS